MPPKNEKISKISRIANDSRYLFSLDIKPEELPVKVTKEDIPKRLPTILVLGTGENLAQLDRLANEDPKIREWIHWFPKAVEELNILHEAANTKNIALLSKVPDEDYWKLKQLFPNTMKELDKELKPLLPQPRKPEPIGPTYPIIVFPRPKKRRYTWMGMNIGEEDLGTELKVIGEIIKSQYMERLLSKYPPDVVEKAIEHVSRRFPHLNKNTESFWRTVESRADEYHRLGRFIDI